MNKGFLLNCAEAVGIGVLLGYLIKRVYNIVQAKVPNVESEEYKESNIEDVDDIDTVCEKEDENTTERVRMQKELLKLKRFRANYIKGLDDTALTQLYNLTCH